VNVAWKEPLIRTFGFALLTLAAVQGCTLFAGLDGIYELVACPEGDVACVSCHSADDCGTPPPCRFQACVEGRCETLDALVGTPCPTGVCSAASPPTCIECILDTDCGNGAYCHAEACARCNDNSKNGDEYDTDCGGHCPSCLGQPCTGGNACKSGFCIDGFCCESECSKCTKCGGDGQCAYTPQFEDDVPDGCAGTETCNGGGLCALRPGEPCVSNVECASLTCEGGECTGP
jgi:hypothetical protein